MDISQNWILFAFLTPTLWAIACLVDSCLINENIYKSPADGVMVSCLFCLLPALFAASVHYSTESIGNSQLVVPLSAVVAGIAYAIHILFYFRTLYCLNDVSGTETFVALSVLIVPFFAWLILDEILAPHYYLAFALAAFGVFLQCLPVYRKIGRSIIANMIICVVTVSLSMVLQAHAFTAHGFAVSTLSFNLSCFASALLFLLFNPALRHRVFELCRKFPAVLIVTEVLGVLAVLCSHRATQLGPSVSIVALIECMLPLFIIAISILALKINRQAQLLSGRFNTTLEMQLSGVKSKCLALALLLVSLLSLSM